MMSHKVKDKRRSNGMYKIKKGFTEDQEEFCEAQLGERMTGISCYAVYTLWVLQLPMLLSFGSNSTVLSLSTCHQPRTQSSIL